MRHLAGSDANLGRMPENTQRNGGFDFSKLLRKSKNDKQQF